MLLSVALPLIALVVFSGEMLTFAESADPGTSSLPVSGVPDAMAFCSLTAQTSVGAPIICQTDQQVLRGTLNNTARWIADDLFGYVLDCSAERYDSIILDSIPVGTQGPVAVNLWFKSNTSANNGNEYSYLLSALAQTTLNVSAGHNPYISNSLQLMLPQAHSNRSGLVRAIVEDRNDTNLMENYLDSDGQFNFSGATPASPGSKSVSDGAWHMVTVTTHTDASHGYLLYVDGHLTGQLPNNNTNVTYGGDPMFLNGNMFLCARADGAAGRFFSGSVANASFFNEALSQQSVAALYSYSNASTADEATANSTVSSITTVNGTFCAFPFTYQDTLQSECVFPSQGAGSKYCRDTNGAFLPCATASSDTAIPTAGSPVSSPVIAGEIVTSPNAAAAIPTVGSPGSSPLIAAALQTTPASHAATDAGGTDDGSFTAGRGQGLSKGAIAGIVLGSIAAATLLTTLIAFVIIKTMGPGGHKRLQEAPSSKFLVHNNSLDRQVEMAKAADAKEAQNELFHGPQSSTDFNIVASS